MLHLSRKMGESIILNDTIEVTVLEIKGKTVKLGIKSSENIPILRREIFDRIKEKNINAANSTAILNEALNEY